jgi:hypothetical protein
VLHLLANHRSPRRIDASKVDGVGVQSRDLREQLQIGGDGSWLAAVAKNGSSIGQELPDKAMGKAHSIGVCVIDDRDLLQL